MVEPAGGTCCENDLLRINVNKAKIEYANVTAYARIYQKKTERVEPPARGNAPKATYINEANMKHAKAG